MEELVKSTADVALARGAKMISTGHLKACITSNEKFDFLEEIVQGVPDLPAADEAKLATTKTAKRERAAPNPAVPGSLDDDDYGAPPPMKVMRAEADKRRRQERLDREYEQEYFAEQSRERARKSMEWQRTQPKIQQKKR